MLNDICHLGDEYRCIHFRTGALGQATRTALPVFGYFIDKVLADPAFKHYHAKYPKAKEDIPRDTYEGSGVYIPRETANDSTDVDDDEAGSSEVSVDTIR